MLCPCLLRSCADTQGTGRRKSRGRQRVTAGPGKGQQRGCVGTSSKGRGCWRGNHGVSRGEGEGQRQGIIQEQRPGGWGGSFPWAAGLQGAGNAVLGRTSSLSHLYFTAPRWRHRGERWHHHQQVRDGDVGLGGLHRGDGMFNGELPRGGL